ncbi:MAG: hypothetical protein U1E31_00380 [Rickettsiales bacterium]
MKEIQIIFQQEQEEENNDIQYLSLYFLGLILTNKIYELEHKLDSEKDYFEKNTYVTPISILVFYLYTVLQYLLPLININKQLIALDNDDFKNYLTKFNNEYFKVKILNNIKYIIDIISDSNFINKENIKILFDLEDSSENFQQKNQLNCLKCIFKIHPFLRCLIKDNINLDDNDITNIKNYLSSDIKEQLESKIDPLSELFTNKENNFYLFKILDNSNITEIIIQKIITIIENKSFKKFKDLLSSKKVKETILNHSTYVKDIINTALKHKSFEIFEYLMNLEEISEFMDDMSIEPVKLKNLNTNDLKIIYNLKTEKHFFNILNFDLFIDEIQVFCINEDINLKQFIQSIFNIAISKSNIQILEFLFRKNHFHLLESENSILRITKCLIYTINKHIHDKDLLSSLLNTIKLIVFNSSKKITDHIISSILDIEPNLIESFLCNVMMPILKVIDHSKISIFDKLKIVTMAISTKDTEIISPITQELQKNLNKNTREINGNRWDDRWNKKIYDTWYNSLYNQHLLEVLEKAVNVTIETNNISILENVLKWYEIYNINFSNGCDYLQPKIKLFKAIASSNNKEIIEKIFKEYYIDNELILKETLDQIYKNESAIEIFKIIIKFSNIISGNILIDIEIFKKIFDSFFKIVESYKDEKKKEENYQKIIKSLNKEEIYFIKYHLEDISEKKIQEFSDDMQEIKLILDDDTYL